MSIKIQSDFRDWTGIIRILHARSKKAKQRTDRSFPVSNINKVAEELHPGAIPLRVVSVMEASPTSKTVRFVSENNKIPYFEAGQFMTVSHTVGNSYVTRPYSISSAPFEALGNDPFVEITVRKGKGGFFSDYLFHDVKAGDEFTCVVGLGQFNYDEIRDSKNVVAIAEGSGITPFASMAKEIEHGTLDMDLTILYGSRFENDIVLKKTLDSIQTDKVRVIYVLSDETNEKYEHGFINENIIKKYSTEDSSFFLSGPEAMISFVTGELQKMNVSRKRIRLDYGSQPKNISELPDYPEEKMNKKFSLTVHQGISSVKIPCDSNESVLVALERAGFRQDNACRGGYCGFCRTKLISGKVYVYSKVDYRRAADKEFNYIHACSSYPLSDIEIRIPIGNGAPR